MRRIAQELRPELLEHLGLVSALTELSRRFAEQSGVAVERRFAAGLPQLSAEAELAIYRVAQESLTNVARHAHAGHVELALEPGADSVVLRVIDDGVGMTRRRRRTAAAASAACASARCSSAASLAVKPGRGGGIEVRLEVPAGAA